MTRKTAICYKRVFQFIEENIFALKPNEIMTDFEGGMRKAINSVYPDATLRGCWFHFNLSINRKCRKMGLSRILKSNEKARHLKTQILHLPLLPMDNINRCFFTIKRNATKDPIIWQHLARFFKYFESYWLSQVV